LIRLFRLHYQKQRMSTKFLSLFLHLLMPIYQTSWLSCSKELYSTTLTLPTIRASKIYLSWLLSDLIPLE
jgi:hypothetical protein